MTEARQEFWRLTIHEVLPSTSDLCRSLAAQGEPEGYAALALQQTQGRGSRGRDWQSPVGNFYGSALLRPHEAARDAGQWSLLAGVALASALAPLLPDPAAMALKWPNDVLLGGAKLAGILVDSAAAADGTLEWLVIGAGVNLAVAPDVPGRAVAAVADVAPPPSPQAFAARFLAELDRWRRVRALHGFEPIRQAWLARAPQLGTPTTLRVGEQLLGGDFAGLSGDGALLLHTGSRIQAFSTGEVLL